MQKTTDGFVTADDLTPLKRLVHHLSGAYPDLNAFLEHTGGGLFCVNVTPRTGGPFLRWGIDEDVWTADLNDADGDYLHSLTTSLAGSSVDMAQVAREIREASIAAVQETPTGFAASPHGHESDTPK